MRPGDIGSAWPTERGRYIDKERRRCTPKEAPRDAERTRSKGKHQSEDNDEEMIKDQKGRWIESTLHYQKKRKGGGIRQRHFAAPSLNKEKSGSGILLLEA